MIGLDIVILEKLLDLTVEGFEGPCGVSVFVSCPSKDKPLASLAPVTTAIVLALGIGSVFLKSN